jgi:hypothetical protein
MSCTYCGASVSSDKCKNCGAPAERQPGRSAHERMLLLGNFGLVQHWSPAPIESIALSSRSVQMSRRLRGEKVHG